MEGKHEFELCEISGQQIPAPFRGDRYCDQFQQSGCECEKCNIDYPVVNLTLRSWNAKITNADAASGRKADPDDPRDRLW